MSVAPNSRRLWPAMALASFVVLLTGAGTAAAQQHQHGQPAATPAAQPGHGQHGCQGAGCQGMQHMGMGGDASHMQDMEVFHFLVDHGKDIRRTIKVLPNGVETVTESDDPAIVDKLRVHVVSMSARVAEKRPIHQRDPLFAEVFKHAGDIAISHESTAKGIKVVETSGDPYVARLIQAHAEVVTLFIKNGRSEMMKNHEVPAR